MVVHLFHKLEANRTNVLFVSIKLLYSAKELLQSNQFLLHSGIFELQLLNLLLEYWQVLFVAIKMSQITKVDNLAADLAFNLLRSRLLLLLSVLSL